MLDTLKGKISAKLLGASSHYPVNPASLVLASVISLGLAAACFVFALAQWKIAGNIMHLQQQQSATITRRLAATSDMAAQQANTHRATLNFLLSRDIQEADEADAARQRNLEDYSSYLSRLDSVGMPRESWKSLEKLVQQYGEVSQKIVDLARAGRQEEAADLRVSELRPVFNQWQKNHAAFTQKLATAGMQQQKLYDQHLASMRQLLAALLLGPIFLVLAGMVMVGVTLGIKAKRSTSDKWAR